MKKLVVGNWKMNPASWKEARRIIDSIRSKSKRFKNVTTVLCPPSPYLGLSLLCNISFGAQDIFYESEGAYTGGISAKMIKSFGINYVIVGHSERRALGDTDEIINKKIKLILGEKMFPILCVGENTRDHHSHYLHFVREQIHSALKGVSKNLIGKIIIAYEPVWAIGKNASGVLDGEEALHMNIFIRKVISDIAGESVAKKIKILYGGSVDVKNSTQFISIGKMDGLLVGRESLIPKNFLQIIENTNRA